MKLVPGPLPPLPTGATMDRLPVPLPFSPDLLWRYPLGFPAPQHQGPPKSPLMDKTHLPNALTTDPRLWSKDDVITFLKWSEREFDIKPFDLDMFQMNGKALCLLTRNDLSERSPCAGDVLHNVLQLLIRDATLLQRCLPSSPVTPTSRHAYPLSPHSHPSTPNWNILAQNTESFYPNPAVIAAHLMAHSNSVILSPAPSVDSQAGSPQHVDSNQTTYLHAMFGSGQSNGSGSNQSDSDEDSYQVASPQNMKPSRSPPSTPGIHGASASMSQQQPQQPQQQQQSQQLPRSPKRENPSSAGAFQLIAREFFPTESPEPNTNGRLLWDFLQQLLNDPTQRYTNYIAWKNRDTGVFKIVDPAGLAKLWGIQKNHLSMNYDKMSRALRYYYRVNILRKVQGERHCYQFLRNPTELKNIKNISLLRQQMSPTRLTAPSQVLQNNQVSITIKPESVIDPMEHCQTNIENEEEKKPTDLSMIHHPYQFIRNSSELKNIDNISLFRQQMSPTRLTAPTQVLQNNQVSITIKPELVIDAMEHNQSNTNGGHEEDKPTDLSMVQYPADLSISHQPTDLSSTAQHLVNTSADSNNEIQFHHIKIKPDIDADK